MKKQDILDRAVDSHKFNSNNDWGFGGARGKRYNFGNGCTLTIATASYRHRPCQKFIRFDIPDEWGCVYVDQATTKTWERISNLLNKYEPYELS